MDDEEVVLDFVADVEAAVAGVDELRDATQELAVATQETKAGLDGVRDASVEAGAASDGLRDRLTEVAAAAGMYRDEMGRLRDAQGRFVAESALEDLALGHTRDEALEAAAAMRALKDEKRAAADSGMLSGLTSMLGGAGGGLSGALSGIPLLGSLAEAPELLVVIIPLVAALVTGLAALATGFAAAALGAGAFAALALPAFKQVFGALGDTKEQLAKLPEPVQQAVAGVKGLKDEFANMSRAFEPTAFKVLNEALKLANVLLPDVSKFANAAAPGISAVIGMFTKAAEGGGFKHFMSFLASLSGPVITAVGSGMMGLGKDVARLMESFSKKDVINAVNIAFRLLGAALEVVIGIVKFSMAWWDALTRKDLPAAAHAFDVTRHAVATAGHAIASTFDTLRHAAAEFGHDWAHYFDTARHDAASFAHDTAHYFDDVRHAVAELGHDTAVWFDRIRHDIAQWAGDVRTDTGRVVSWFRALPGEVMRVLASLPGEMLQAGRNIISSLISGAGSMISGGISTLAGWGHDLANALMSPFGLHFSEPSDALQMIKAGVNTVMSFAQGVRTAAPAARAALSAALGGASAIQGVPVAGAIAALGPAGMTHNFNVNVNAQGAFGSPYKGPQFEQFMQREVQEAVLRYGQLNPTNGLTLMWGR